MISNRLEDRAVGILPCVAAILFLVLVALAHPTNHDESQYVAATDLVSGGLLPYRDFAYLQTPLQPLLFAPLDWIVHERLFLLSRLANALLAAISLVFVYGSARRLGASKRAALYASALPLTCYAFLYSAGLARNDMLPAALLSAGLWVWLGAEHRWQHFAAGILLGLAASAKISYAVPAAAIFAAGFFGTGGDGRRNSIWLAAGQAAGLLPVIVLAALAPKAFLFEAIVFPARAPTLYYDEIGKHWKLGEFRLLRILLIAAIGPTVIVAAEIVRRCIRRPAAWIGDPKRRVLAAAVAGGILSAVLNRPFNTPYLVPALIPLFILATTIFSEREPLGTRMRWLLSLSSVAGIAPAISWIALALAFRGWPAMLVEQRNEQIGAALRAIHVHGPIASLRGDFLVDTDYPLDPDFAAGPFLFRTLKFVPSNDAASWHIVTRDQALEMAVTPPAAIVTGFEPEQPQLDARLTSEAEALGFAVAPRRANFTILIPERRCGSGQPGSPVCKRSSVGLADLLSDES